MLFRMFAKKVKAFFDEHFIWLEKSLKSGDVTGDGRGLYPSHVVCSEYNGFFGVELLGARTQRQSLVLKMRKSVGEVSIFYDLFNDIEGDAVTVVATEDLTFENLTLAHRSDYESAKIRFPVLGDFPSVIEAGDRTGTMLQLQDSCSKVCFSNVVLLNRRDQIIRCKHISLAFLLRTNQTWSEFKAYFERSRFSSTENGRAVRGLIYAKSADAATVAQLQNAFLSQGNHETLIGDFVKNHPEIVIKAFDATSFVYEPNLSWQEHDGTITDTSINPDLCIERKDGTFDIADFKLAKLEERNLTVGQIKRKDLGAYLSSGLAQLAHYREYFTYAKNATLAKEKYGIVVHNPKLILIAGHSENLRRDDLRLALRSSDKACIVIDYDTLCALFMKGAEREVGVEDPVQS